MQKSKSRALSLLTAIAMVATMLPTAALAADPGYTYDSGVLTISTNEGSVKWRNDKGLSKSEVTSVKVIEGVTVLGKMNTGAFDGCTNLNSVELPDSLGGIYEYAFKNCESLESIIIPAKVKMLAVGLFENCEKLSSITLKHQDGIVFLAFDVFVGLPEDYKVYVPMGKLEDYKKASNWVNIKDHIFGYGSDPDPDPTPDPAPSTGGSSGGSGNGPAAAPTQKIVNTPTATKTSAANSTQTYRNYDVLTPDGAKTIAGKSTEVNFDKIVGNKVLSRITMNPADLAKAVTKNVKLGVHFDEKDKAVSAVASKLGKYFSNKMVLVTYDQKNVLPVNAEFAARLDLSGLNTKTLYFYSYDSTTNKYAQISAPNYFVDSNGYVHFTAPFGGTVIITDAPLAK